jgi:hypothetical protein
MELVRTYPIRRDAVEEKDVGEDMDRGAGKWRPMVGRNTQEQQGIKWQEGFRQSPSEQEYDIKGWLSTNAVLTQHRHLRLRHHHPLNHRRTLSGKLAPRLTSTTKPKIAPLRLHILVLSG